MKRGTNGFAIQTVMNQPCQKAVKLSVLDELVDTHGPNLEAGEPVPPFWIFETAKAQRPAYGTMSNCGTQVFPGEYFEYTGHVLGSLVSGQFKEQGLKKKTLAQTSENQYTHLGVKGVPLAKNANIRIRVGVGCVKMSATKNYSSERFQTSFCSPSPRRGEKKGFALLYNIVP
eukprot:scaffold34639_cov206-Amphora_coffeaeformis.AAC.10